MAKKDQFVADSSVVAKWFLTETGSDRAIELRDEFAAGRLKLAVPSLLFYEVMNALRFSGGFASPDLLVAAESLSRYRFDIWRPRGKLLRLSSELSMREDLSVYDASYVALAQRTDSMVITEDRYCSASFHRRPWHCPSSDRIPQGSPSRSSARLHTSSWDGSPLRPSEPFAFVDGDKRKSQPNLDFKNVKASDCTDGLSLQGTGCSDCPTFDGPW